MEARRGQVPQQRDWFMTAVPETGQAQNNDQRLLKAIRRWQVRVSRDTHELPEATPPDITPKRRNDVLRVDRVDHPKPAFLRNGLNV